MTLRAVRPAFPRRATRGRALRASLAATALLPSVRSGAALAEEGSSFALEWSAPQGCPDGAAARARVDALLGRAAASRAERALAVRATVTRSEGGADVSLETTDGGLRGARTLHGSTCDEVTSAAALVIALAIDPKAVAAHSQSTGVVAFDPPAVGPTSAPGGSPCPPPPVPNAPPPIIVRVPVPAPATSDVSAFLDAGVVADVGSLPGPSAGPTARAGIASHRFGARLGVAYLTPRFAAAPPEAGRPTRGADVSLVTSDLLGCYALIPGATALDVCGGLEAGALFAEGQAFQRSNAALKPWLAAVAGIELAVPVAGPLTLRAQLGAAVPFGRSPVQFRSTTGNITELREIYRPSVVDGRAVAAASVTFF